MTNLKKKNQDLEKEKRKRNISLQTTVSRLQSQMSEALGTAIRNKAAMESELQEAKSKIAELETRLLRQSSQGNPPP